jgi:hypothetical protein
LFALRSSWQAVRIRSADHDPLDGYRRQRATVYGKLLKLRDADGYQKAVSVWDGNSSWIMNGSRIVLAMVVVMFERRRLLF